MSWAWIHLIRPTLFVQLQLSCEKSHMYWLPRLASSSDAKTGQILDLNGLDLIKLTANVIIFIVSIDTVSMKVAHIKRL